MVQRYKFESKSQPVVAKLLFRSRCFQWFKDTNLKVNHNLASCCANFNSLFPMVQRYKFESKSQQSVLRKKLTNRCFQWFKDTNLKVNHNYPFLISFVCKVVSNGSKIQI